jgi:hypothetical protein
MKEGKRGPRAILLATPRTFAKPCRNPFTQHHLTSHNAYMLSQTLSSDEDMCECGRSKDLMSARVTIVDPLPELHQYLHPRLRLLTTSRRRVLYNPFIATLIDTIMRMLGCPCSGARVRTLTTIPSSMPSLTLAFRPKNGQYYK